MAAAIGHKAITVPLLQHHLRCRKLNSRFPFIFLHSKKRGRGFSCFPNRVLPITATMDVTSGESGGSMRAMVLEMPKTPLKSVRMSIPEPPEGHLRVRVTACAVCRTDLHVDDQFYVHFIKSLYVIIMEACNLSFFTQFFTNLLYLRQVDGDLEKPKLPIIPGHEIVGMVDKIGEGVDCNLFSIGKRVGIPWLGRTCGKCTYCLEGTENLCDDPGFTGYQIDGGYAEYAVAHAAYCFPLPEVYTDIEVAPLLCAGLIGYRSLRKTGFKPGLDKKKRIGIYGFGAAAHIIAQVAIYEGHQIYAFTRAGDRQAQEFALRLGATWAGDSNSLPPNELDAAILFAPVGLLVPAALKAVRKGGIVVAGGIHMSQIPAFPYSILWGERQVVSVANLTRQDAFEFLELAPKARVKTETVVFSLDEANEALASLREGRLEGAAVLVP